MTGRRAAGGRAGAGRSCGRPSMLVSCGVERCGAGQGGARWRSRLAQAHVFGRWLGKGKQLGGAAAAAVGGSGAILFLAQRQQRRRQHAAPPCSSSLGGCAGAATAAAMAAAGAAGTSVAGTAAGAGAEGTAEGTTTMATGAERGPCMGLGRLLLTPSLHALPCWGDPLCWQCGWQRGFCGVPLGPLSIRERSPPTGLPLWLESLLLPAADRPAPSAAGAAAAAAAATAAAAASRQNAAEAQLCVQRLHDPRCLRFQAALSLFPPRRPAAGWWNMQRSATGSGSATRPAAPTRPPGARRRPQLP